MTRADLKHCGKISDAREELSRSVREGKIESRHSNKFGRDGTNYVLLMQEESIESQCKHYII